MSSILSALMGGGGPQGGPPPGPPGPPPGSGGGDPVEALKAALAAIHQFVEEADDDVDRQTALQCYAKLQSIVANEQKQNEAALGTTPAHKALSKHSARNSGGY